jgi:chemotaxis protein CheD
MNHYVLPHRMAELPSPRFGDVAIEQPLDGMARLGCRVGSLQAKIYGGAEVLPFGAHGDTVGEQNVRIALELLQHYRIPILTRRTGGRSGMQIRLYSETGDVMVRRLAADQLVETDQSVAGGVALSDGGDAQE